MTHHDTSEAFPRYEGLIPAAYTPFDGCGNLLLEAVPRLAERYRGDRAPAVFVAGTTGECHSLSVVERRALAEAWVESAGDPLAVLVHVGANAQVDAIELAAHARSVAAQAVACLAPSYFRPESAEDLVDFLAPVAAAADPLPFYFYDIPALTGVAYPADQVLRIARDRIGNFAGIKFTSPDLMRLQSCVRQDQGEILYGNDETLLAGLSLGCVGAVGSTYNYAASLYRGVLDAFAAGDLAAARAAQLESVRLVAILLEHGVLRAGKAIMRMVGVDCGSPRPPIRSVDEGEARLLRDKLQQSGLLDAMVHTEGAHG